MDKKLTFTGGEPNINFNDILRTPNANLDALFAIIEGIEPTKDFIIQGCTVTINAGVDAQTTAGYIFLNGEILEVESQTVVETLTTDLWEFQKQVTYDPLGDKTFNDGTPRQTWQKNRGVLVNVSAVTGMDASSTLNLNDLSSNELNYKAVTDTNATILSNERLIKYTGTAGGPYTLTLNDGEYDGDKKTIIYDLTSGESFSVRDADLNVLFSIQASSNIVGVSEFKYDLTNDDWYLVSSSHASSSYRGQFKESTTSSVDTGTATDEAVTPYTLEHKVGETLKRKTIDIGDWNMDTTSGVNVAHGLTLSKIRGVTVLITADTGVNLLSDLVSSEGAGGGEGGYIRINATNVQLSRISSGKFDNSSYDETSYNRGWVIILYEP